MPSPKLSDQQICHAWLFLSSHHPELSADELLRCTALWCDTDTANIIAAVMRQQAKQEVCLCSR